MELSAEPLLAAYKGYWKEYEHYGIISCYCQGHYNFLMTFDIVE